jgi:hypothetical protein
LALSPEQSPGKELPVNNKQRGRGLDLLLVVLIRELQKKGSRAQFFQQILKVLAPQLRRVTEIQLLAPGGEESFEAAWRRVESGLYMLLKYGYDLDKNPQTRLPMHISFALLDRLRIDRERLCPVRVEGFLFW